MTLSRRSILGLSVPLCSALALKAQEAKSNTEKLPRKWGAAPTAEFAPQRVILGWTGDPAHTQAITWRTDKRAETPQVQFAPASANPDFVSGAATVPAKAGSLDVGEGRTVGTYRANLQGLKPDTHYLYRAGDGKNWGEWFEFHTASDQPQKFRFLYVGDAQNDIKSRWSRVIRAAYAKAPNSAFIIHAGDLVASGYRDDLWGEWYDSMEFIAATIPSLAVVGNHELEKPAGTPKSLALPAIWKQEFAYPQNGPGLPENESYYFDYQGVRFLSLNVNLLENEKNFDANRPAIGQMVAWVDKALDNNPNRWTIVTQHQGMYSMAEKRNYVKMREMLLPTYEKYGVDLVLQGHDHLYARSHKIAGGKVVAGDARGIVYMISVSGPKMYEVTPTFEPLMAKVIPHTQMFQTIDVDQNKLVLRAYSPESEQLDGFQLEKKGGHSIYSELPKTETADAAVE
ncbi:MAG: metallophosphoesterase family protein [Candidatus Sulfopaludibacter sp.]|nr:metallophosphoesterase family protein [Candidatus Sulfopaludibacter sp.]